ncbi:hypothetical protein OROMI_022367 [Orobanche minor]
MVSSPNVRPSPKSATGADAESASAAAAAAASAADAAAADAAAADADAAADAAETENQVVWKRPNMRGSKCSINGYVRLGIVKTITAELRSVGDDTFREFRESCLGHFIREEWGGFVSNAALHALFSNEVVRPDAQVDEFWFRIGHRLIRFSRYEYALVTGLRFGDSDFDVHGDDVPPEGSVYDRYPLLSCGGQMLDRIRDRFAGGYFREQSGDALKVAKVLCVCYLIFGVDGGKRIADRWLWTLVEDQTRWERFPWGLYSYQILVTYLSDVPTEVPAGLDPGYHFYGNIYAIMIWACEAIPSSARGTQETAPITDFDTLFTRLHTCIQSAVQEMRQYVDAVVEKSVKDVCRHIDELVRESAPIDTPSWDFEGINELMRNSPIEPRFDRAPIPPDQTMSVPDAGRSSLPTETRVDGALSPTEKTEEVSSPGRAPVPVEHTSSLDHHADGGSVLTERTRSLDHQSSVPIVTPPVIPTEILVTPPEIAPRTRPSSSTADLSPIPLEYSSNTIPADTYHSPRLQYRSYRPHSPFSTTVVRKRKDLDEEAYRRWLDSGESVNVGAACGASASWFLMLQDASTLIDAEHLDAYMGILQFDPGFVGVRWLDDWAAQTVLVHTSFLATCINVWNNYKRKGGSLSIDDEDLDFLVSHVHGLRPFWGDHRPWWELREC